MSLGDGFDYARHQLDVALVDSEMTAIEFLVAVFDFETLQSLSQDPQAELKVKFILGASLQVQQIQTT